MSKKRYFFPAKPTPGTKKSAPENPERSSSQEQLVENQEPTLMDKVPDSWIAGDGEGDPDGALDEISGRVIPSSSFYGGGGDIETD